MMYSLFCSLVEMLIFICTAVTLLNTVSTMVVSFLVGHTYHVVQIGIFSQIFFVYVSYSCVFRDKKWWVGYKNLLLYFQLYIDVF